MKKHATLDALFAEQEAEGRGVYTYTPAQQRALHRRVQTGEVCLLAKGCYVREKYWESLTYEQRGWCLLRTLACLHPDWILAGTAAAWVSGLTSTFLLLRKFSVAATAGRNPYVEHGVRRVYLTEEETSSIRTINGFRVCGIERTIFDCARSLPLTDSLPLCDKALRDELCTHEQLVAFALRHSRCRRARLAMRAISLASPLSESGGESMARAVIIDLGFAPPQLQVNFEDPVTHRLFRVDFLWKLPNGFSVIGEFDGRQKYVDEALRNGRSIEQVLDDEKSRESHLSIYGIGLLRFGYKELKDPESLRILLNKFHIPRAS
jgi:hypothetical protein